MRELLPKVEVFPFWHVDGGPVVLRARLSVDLAPLLAGGLAAAEIIRREVTVDLFDPPQRIAFRERVVALRAAGRSERQAAMELGLTVTAAQRAMALHRRMQDQGLTDPYQAVTAPPEGDHKFKRHRPTRYRFDPRPGYPARPPAAEAGQ